MRHPLLLLALVLLAFSSCKKDEVKPIDTRRSVKILGHKGSGNTGYFSGYVENTLPSIKNAITRLDGVECDLQMSKDGTIWIWHNNDLGNDCDSTETRSLITLNDSEISQKIVCQHGFQDRIYKLQELIDYWNSHPTGFLMSLEVKDEFSASDYSAVGGRPAYLLKLAKQLATVLKNQNHPDQIFVEVNYGPFLEEFRKVTSGVKLCLINYTPFSDLVSTALNLDYDGVSTNYQISGISFEAVQAAKDMGLVVQLWTPYFLSDLESAIALRPTTIQTDEINAKTLMSL